MLRKLSRALLFSLVLSSACDSSSVDIYLSASDLGRAEIVMSEAEDILGLDFQYLREGQEARGAIVLMLVDTTDDEPRRGVRIDAARCFEFLRADYDPISVAHEVMHSLAMHGHVCDCDPEMGLPCENPSDRVCTAEDREYLMYLNPTGTLISDAQRENLRQGARELNNCP